MQHYRFYVRKSGGAFGAHESLAFPADEEAVRHGARLVDRFGGCDVWRNEERVALMLPESRDVQGARDR